MEVLNYKEFKVTDEMLASTGSRILNNIIDTIVFYLIFIFLFFIIGLIVEIIANDQANEFVNKLVENSMFIPIFILFFYFSVMEFLTGKSVGKAITRTTVVLENGEKPNYKTIAIRTVSRFVPFEWISFLGTPSRGWHDSWSNTYVVRDTVLKEHKRLHQQFLELGESNDN